MFNPAPMVTFPRTVIVPLVAVGFTQVTLSVLFASIVTSPVVRV